MNHVSRCEVVRAGAGVKMRRRFGKGRIDAHIPRRLPFVPRLGFDLASGTTRDHLGVIGPYRAPPRQRSSCSTAETAFILLGSPSGRPTGQPSAVFGGVQHDEVQGREDAIDRFKRSHNILHLGGVSAAAEGQ